MYYIRTPTHRMHALSRRFLQPLVCKSSSFWLSSTVLTLTAACLVQYRTMSSNNNHQQLVAPQDPIQWNHTPETVISETERLIADAKALDDKLAAIPLNDANIDNVILPYADLENRQAGLYNQLSFYQHVSADKALREASNEADAKFRKYGIDAGLREDVFKVINKVYLDNKDNANLDSETVRFIEKLNKQYERNGLSLPLETREKVKALKQELSVLALKFSSNLSEETGFNLYTREQLEGVPEDVVKGFETVEEDGVTRYKMTFKYPDLFPVLKYAKDAETRKTAFTADQNKCPENADILIKAVKIRAELSQLLGYKNFSEYILEERMAKTPENVMNFLQDLKVKLKPLGEKEVQYLKSLKAKETGKDDDGYYIWDQRYFHTKMLENDYNVDEIKISEFFPMQNTIAKMLSIYETIFSLKFVEISKSDKAYNTWHEDVKQYQVWKMDDPQTPVFIGYLYFDLHPRAGKYGHAANFGQVPSYIDIQTGKKNYPSTSLVCNFTKDTDEKPSLLKHGEVVTFFHELGHGIHDLMGQTKYSRFHGTAVSWDFVEMPSQLLEYFCWDESMLTKLSSHYKTGESLPKDLIKSLVSSKNVNGAMFNLRQLHFGLFDMALHTSKDGDVDVNKLWNDMREEICLISNGGVDFKGYGSFGHLMGGYASGYYGYLWSNVFAADVFFTKFAEDPLNVKNGMDYRNKILARGGSRDEMDNLVDLLGRKPESTNFLKELGL